jgi:hypothetical protein
MNAIKTSDSVPVALINNPRICLPANFVNAS